MILQTTNTQFKYFDPKRSYRPTLTLQMQYWSRYHNRSKWVQNLWKITTFWIWCTIKTLNTSIFRSRLVVNQCVWSSSGTFYPTSLVISVNVAGIKSPIITSFIILTHCLTILGAISFFVRKIISLVICILFIAWGRNIYKTNKK